MTSVEATTPPYAVLDPSIRETVRWVTSLGFETIKSGAGANIGKPGDCPYVHFRINGFTDRDAAHTVVLALLRRGIDLDPDEVYLKGHRELDGSTTISLHGVDDVLLAASPTPIAAATPQETS